MAQDMTYRNRYILTLVMLLTAWFAGGSAMAEDEPSSPSTPTSTGVHIHGSVYGGGRGKADSFTCAKGMVGINERGDGIANPGTNSTYKDYGTRVIINSGTVDQNVYGGGMVGRVEWNTQVTIGSASGTSAPEIGGSVFGAGKGLETHGYSALVRGDCTVTIQNRAKVGHNVYGGGEKATAGRYKVASETDLTDEFRAAHPGIEIGMPYETKTGGKCTVIVKDYAQIGPDGEDVVATETAGHVFGAGQGVDVSNPDYSWKYGADYDKEDWSKRMVNYNYDASQPEGKRGPHSPEAKEAGKWDYYVDENGEEDRNYVWEYLDTKDKYNNFLQTLALVTNTSVTINGNTSITSVKGSVYGGSENGFVQDQTVVSIQNGNIGTEGSYGNVFGGGKGIAVFSESGKVKGTTSVTISGGTMYGSVYGGGELGDVGTINKSNIRNYTWIDDTGECEVVISGDDTEIKGNVFGAGKGEAIPTTFWCEKAMVYQTSVEINAGKVGLNVYGGGEKGRVENNTDVTIGSASGTSKPEIAGSVFGAGMGIVTHGYSALVRNNTTVTIQAQAEIGKSVYGGGEIASVGRYGLDAKGMPSILLNGGQCTVTIKDAAKIGLDDGGNVFGAGWGHFPSFSSSGPNRSKRMMTYNSSYKDADEHTKWDYSDDTEEYVWEYFTETQYSNYLETLALATHPIVTIGEGTGGVEIHGTVFGGGEKGITKGDVDVEIQGGTIDEDVYGGGALANTNTGNWSPNKNYVQATTPLNEDESYFKKEFVYTIITDESAVAEEDVTYYTKDGETYAEATDLEVGDPVKDYYTKSETYTAISYEVAAANPSIAYETQGAWTDETKKTALHKTVVKLLGGYIKGYAYGGGLGQLGVSGGEGDAAKDIPASVYGDVLVDLNGTTTSTVVDGFKTYGTTGSPISSSSKGCIVSRVFGCNNVNGSPKGNVTVHVYATQNSYETKTTINDKFSSDNVNYDALDDTSEGLTDEQKAIIRSTLKGILQDKITIIDELKDEITELAGIDVSTYQATHDKSNATATELKTAITDITEEIDDAGSTDARKEEIKGKIDAFRYDVEAVYGGGNMAAYIPAISYDPTSAPTGSKTQVIIEGCYITSIETVYGGGNAASVPETNLLVKEAYEIGYVFGGGNGKDDIKVNGVTTTNPGADVGLYDDEAYGTGNANTLITGGYIHEAYGGSNERGTINHDTNFTANADPTPGACPMLVEKMVTAGKNADILGNAITILGCMPDSWVKEYYGGADNANVHGNVELTITSGKFRKLFGGNNRGGIIMGHIKVNIEETGCQPILIDELYLGGNKAPYSAYGYYITNKSTASTDGKLTFGQRESETDTHKAVESFEGTTYRESSSSSFKYDKQPELNIISCTHIGKVFGGGLGVEAKMYANPTVNINMIKGEFYGNIDDDNADNPNQLGEIGAVYGGGNQADVNGNTTVNICTATKVEMTSLEKVHAVEGDPEYDPDLAADAQPMVYQKETVEGAYISGNVYGGGKGEAKTDAGEAGEAFLCAKAMVNGDEGTHVNIGNGIVVGSVYGGGEVGRVENNTEVTIGLANAAPDTSMPIIKGNVFGAGAGVNTHGYSALVRGTSTVTVQADAKVLSSVYGGGEKASVGRYKVVQGLPQVLDDSQNPYSGYCYVTIKDNAEIGPDNMRMDKDGLDDDGNPLPPDDTGYVFGAGKGVLPYEGYDDGERPQHMNGTQVLDEEGKWDGKSWADAPTSYDPYDHDHPEADLDADYEKFIKSLALATQTIVTIEGTPFVKGGVYGGSENGFVQHDTHVIIKGGQIGSGHILLKDEDGDIIIDRGLNRPYTAAEWSAGHLTATNADFTSEELTADAELVTKVNSSYAHSLPECASWPYGEEIQETTESGTITRTIYAPYDKFASKESGHEEEYSDGRTTHGGRRKASDGHTFFGNVFGGGSGYFPYRPGKWFEYAGAVYGNTYLTITGGHILTSVYGGNEMTDVGKGLIYDDADKRERGKCYVTMTGGTVGVPRTLDQIDAHPVTCYLFGAGKGDPRVFFNKSTNVRDVAIHISDDARIYGSVFGGGEDGHVLKDVTMNIGSGNSTLPDNPVIDELFEDVTLRGCYADNHLPLIGTWGTSYVDGNVFGAGRGFTGEAYTAGNVGGSVTMNLLGGTMYGSIYGGGRLGSVGYGLYPDDAGATYYGAMRPDNKDDDASNSNVPNFKRGYVTMTIGNEDDGTGPIIGNTLEYKIPSASNGPTSQGENPVPTLPADVTSWTDVQWTAWKAHNNMPKTEFEYNESKGYYMLKHTKGGNVYAAGMGRQTNVEGVNWWKLGSVKETKLTIYGGRILSNVYGGGELGAVVPAEGTTLGGNTEIIIQGGTIGSEVAEAVTTTTTPEEGDPVTTTDDVVRYTFGSVFGGGMGNEAIATSEDLIGGRVEGSTKITMTAGIVLGSVYGGGELAVVKGSHTTKNSKNENFAVGTEINISGGVIGKEKSGTTYFGGATMGNVYGGGKGSTSTFIAGLVKSNTKVSISNTLADQDYVDANPDEEVSVGTVLGEPKIYHNIYGGGAYASVGTYTYDSSTGTTTCATGTGKTEVIVTGGIIGIDGDNNGMVFGSSRGDVATPTGSPAVDPNDMLAWVNETHVVIGADGQGTTTPQINGSVYGSGENGHTYTNTVIDVHSGTIGIVSGSPIANPDDSEHPYTGPNFPNRGNVYGGGCGTDMYDSDGDGTKDSYNSLAGIVLGNATVNIDGGQVVRNVYGAGAMGSVGTMTTDGNGVTTFTSGGTTTIAISGGIVGVDGDENGNVFGAARGDATTTQKDVALVKTTDVQISGTAAIKGNVYGGGEIGCVGTFSETSDGRYVWSSGGLSKVSVTGTTAIVKGNVFGAGKGEANTFKCEKAMVRETSVSISNGTIGTLDNADKLVEGTGNVYGGGEIGRVEYDTEVTVGRKSGETEGNGTGTPTIYGSVFGSGKGEETHGYSALVRGDTHVTVEGASGSTVGRSVYGGGEIASVGRYGLDAAKMPEILLGGGKCTVKVLGNAQIGPANASDDEGNVFGAGKGLPPDSYIENTGDNKETCSRRMMVYDPYNPETGKGRHTTANKGTLWWPYGVGENETPVFVWEYFPDDTTGPEESRKTGEEKYKSYLETLALATAPDVTIGGNAKVNGNVFGGGELGLTKGSVIVKIEGGTIEKDVYGGGSLADTNTTSSVGVVDENGVAEKDGDDNYVTTTVHPTTIVRLTGGQVKGDVYGGGLGQVGVTGEHYTSEEIMGAVEGDDAYGKTTDDWKVEAVRNMPAYVYGNVLVDLNGTTDITVEEGNKIFAATGVRIPDSSTGCKVKRVFGCNNVNGSPRGNVIVHVYRTEDWTGHEKSTHKTNSTYNVEAVYGGGNNAAYEPKDAKDASGNYIAYLIDDSGESTLYKPCVYNEDGTYTLTGGDALSSICKTNVIIEGCGWTSIEEVYGGGNSAPTPATSVIVNSCYEIGTVFGGGNGQGEDNPGANVGYRNYSGQAGDNEDPDDKTIRKHNYSYGTGKAETCLYGGTIHQAFGGSNSRGNVREVAFTALDNIDECRLDIDEIYGAGNKAFMDARIEVDLGCVDHLGTLFGGAKEADVNENIELNVTSGSFGKIFGGNDKGGQIYGTITVNIEETGCHPIVIDELYGGGREADYTAPAPTADHPYSPLVNIISATSIGKVYGGGLDASVEGTPTIKINMEPGTFAADIDTDNDGEADDDDDAIGTIGTVFGGGYNGDIIGNTRVEVGTDPSKKARITNSVFGGGENADVIGKTDVIIGPPIEAIENNP